MEETLNRMSRTVAGRAVIAIGLVGLVVSVLGVAVGLRALSEIGGALDRSFVVTGGALETLDASVEVAGQSLVLLERSLDRTESTTRDVVGSFDEAEALLESTADLSENQIAGSLEAVEDALPTLIEVAAVIDTTLSALALVPFGPDYAPEEAFDESLRSIQREMAGLPDDVRLQATLIRATAANLGEVRRGTVEIADELGELQAALEDAAALLQGYSETATETRLVIESSQEGLADRMGLARVLLVVLGLTFAAGQVVPLGIGWLLLRPEAAEAFLASHRRGDPDLAARR